MKGALDMSNAWRATAYLSFFYYIFGLQLPYLPVWLETARGLNGGQIGAVIFGALLGRIIIGPIVSTWADARSIRMVWIILAGGACLGFLALNFTYHPIALIVVGFFLMSVVNALIPLAEASLLLVAGEEKPSFGQGRALASTAFVVGVFTGGAVIGNWGAAMLVPVMTALFAVLILIAFTGPRIPLGRTDKDSTFWQRMKRGLSLYKRPTLFLLLISVSCVQATHAFYYGFSAVVWEKQGFSSFFISALWAVGIVLEIVFLAMASRFPVWLTPERLIGIGAIGAIVRWTIYGFQPDLATSFVLQNLHALTFAATFIGSIRVVHRDVEKQDQAIVLSLLASVMGAFIGAAGMLSGYLYDIGGAKGYWFMSIISLVGMIFACLLMFRVKTRPAR